MRNTQAPLYTFPTAPVSGHLRGRFVADLGANLGGNFGGYSHVVHFPGMVGRLLENLLLALGAYGMITVKTNIPTPKGFHAGILSRMIIICWPPGT